MGRVRASALVTFVVAHRPVKYKVEMAKCGLASVLFEALKSLSNVATSAPEFTSAYALVTPFLAGLADKGAFCHGNRDFD